MAPPNQKGPSIVQANDDELPKNLFMLKNYTITFTKMIKLQLLGKILPHAGIEPATFCLLDRRSATEPVRHTSGQLGI